MLRKLLYLPKDINNHAIHAPVSEGDLRVAMTYKLKQSRHMDVEGIGREEDGESIVKSQLVQRIIRPSLIRVPCENTNPGLFNNLYTKGL